MRRLFCVACLAFVSLPTLAQSPVADDPAVTIAQVAVIPQSGGQHPIRIAQDPVDERLYVLVSSGILYRLNPDGDGTFTPEVGLTQDDHGTPEAVGMAFAADGTLYLLGNENVGTDQTRFILRRGTRAGAAWAWSTVATSAPYLLSHTWFDHKANGLALSPDERTLYLNSGARTDHGEMYVGVREEGLTALILQVPTDATDLLLPNDRAALRDGGYVFAEGIRNSFDLAFAPNGDLLAGDNAGDRDDSEELNWLREGHHYGFPWRIGTSETPMQFAGYEPAADPFVQPDRNTDNQADTGWYFSDDPSYPAPPPGVTFTDPIPNVGPFADHFRAPGTGAVMDASDQNTTLGTFTAHRSPLGLVFDAEGLLDGVYQGGAFILSWNSADDQLLSRMDGTGEDLLFLDLDKSSGTYTVSATRVAHQFDHPIDAVMVGTVLYVLEYGNAFSPGGRQAVQALTFPAASGLPTEVPQALALSDLRAYPNPASGTLHLDYTLQAPAASVRIDLIDVLGRVVRTHQAPPVPEDRVFLSTEGLPAGLYLARLTAGAVHLSQPVMVVR